MNQLKYYKEISQIMFVIALIRISQIIVVIALIIGLAYSTMNGLNKCQSSCIASAMISK